MSGPSGEPKMIWVTPDLVRSSHFCLTVSGSPAMVKASMVASSTFSPAVLKSNFARAALMLATLARSSPWRWRSGSGEPAAMNAATIFAALRAFFSFMSIDIAVYAPMSKPFLPTLSQAALMIGIATSKSLGFDALIRAPSPIVPASSRTLGPWAPM